MNDIRFNGAFKWTIAVREDFIKSPFILDEVVDEWRANSPVVTPNLSLLKFLAISLKSSLKCKLITDKYDEIVSPLHKWLLSIYMLLTKNTDCNLPFYTVLIGIKKKSSNTGTWNLTRNDISENCSCEEPWNDTGLLTIWSMLCSVSVTYIIFDPLSFESV